MSCLLKIWDECHKNVTWSIGYYVNIIKSPLTTEVLAVLSSVSVLQTKLTFLQLFLSFNHLRKLFFFWVLYSLRLIFTFMCTICSVCFYLFNSLLALQLNLTNKKRKSKTPSLIVFLSSDYYSSRTKLYLFLILSVPFFFWPNSSKCHPIGFSFLSFLFFRTFIFCPSGNSLKSHENQLNVWIYLNVVNRTFSFFF